jgi:outer membrane receptor protein involved in Fe transport
VLKRIDGKWWFIDRVVTLDNDEAAIRAWNWNRKNARCTSRASPISTTSDPPRPRCAQASAAARSRRSIVHACFLEGEFLMKRHLQALSALPLLAAVQGALAQDGSGLEEVIVTATKRETSLQSTPLAITALDSKMLQEQAIFSIDDFRRGAVPMLQIQTLPINPATLQLAVRGISNLDVSQMTRESPVAVYVDGVYLGRTQGLALDLPDLERIELLRGPQGTLFGRNAVGGALNIVTQKPTGELGFSQSLTGGNYGTFRSATTLNLPEVANVSSKLDAFYYTRDGLVENPMDGEHDFAELEKYGGRASLRWRPSIRGPSTTHSITRSSRTRPTTVSTGSIRGSRSVATRAAGSRTRARPRRSWSRAKTGSRDTR